MWTVDSAMRWAMVNSMHCVKLSMTVRFVCKPKNRRTDITESTVAFAAENVKPII